MDSEVGAVQRSEESQSELGLVFDNVLEVRAEALHRLEPST